MTTSVYRAAVAGLTDTEMALMATAARDYLEALRSEAFTRMEERGTTRLGDTKHWFTLHRAEERPPGTDNWIAVHKREA